MIYWYLPNSYIYKFAKRHCANTLRLSDLTKFTTVELVNMRELKNMSSTESTNNLKTQGYIHKPFC